MGRSKLILLLLIFSPALVAADSIDLVLRAGGLRESAPPVVIGSEILFSYRFPGTIPPGAVHVVQAAFSHEGFSRLHTFRRNNYDVFVLAIPRNREVDRITYRLVVDGLWTTDPKNPATLTDRFGVTMSLIDLPAGTRLATATPYVANDGSVEFELAANSGQQVSIVGSFNGWDPFMTPMVETAPGTYRRRMRLPPGDHLYYFMVNGLRLADPANHRRQLLRDGLVVSIVSLP